MNDFEQALDVNFLLRKYKDILFIREFELLIGRKYKEGAFQTPIHLGIGQEAIAVGVSNYLIFGDAVYGNHRSHAHYLALGGSPHALLAEILGKATGCSAGKGGSMHISAPEVGFMGSMPIVGGTIPIALGSALAMKNSAKDSIAVSYFGDGASEEGAFHESLNFAAIFDIPILMVCENNLFSSHMHIDQRQVNRKISRFAHAQDIKVFETDGNDLLEVLSVSKKAVEYVRMERKPAMVEAFTYRQFSHVGFDEDLEVGLNRREDLLRWRGYDPLDILKSAIRAEDPLSNFDWEGIVLNTRTTLEDLWEQALSDPYPGDASLLTQVYWSN